MVRGDQERAQDLVQDTLIRAYEAFLDGRFRDEGTTRAWLLRILTNLFINDRQRREKWESPTDVETLTAEDRITPEALRAPLSDSPEMALLAGSLDEPLE